MEKVLYIETDEEITGVISRIKKEKAKHVVIVVPKGAIMIQSIVNLKMLKKHEKDLEKEITVVTTDKIGLHLASEIGFRALRSLDKMPADEKLVEEKGKERLSLKRDDNSESFDQTVKDIGYSNNKIQKQEEPDGPNIVFKKEAESSIGNKPKVASKNIPDKKEELKKKPRKKISKTMKWLLVGFGFVSLTASILTVLFILPKAEIIVTPITEELREEVEIEVVLSDEHNSISGELIEISKKESKTVETTGTKNVGERATGTITVYNEWDSNPQPLVTGTRFVSDGKIFKTKSDVNVPGTTVSGGNIVPGTANVNVEASEAGDVYNIGSATFTIPGLPAEKQAKIYGKSSGPMSGGSTKSVKVVSGSDIDSAKTALNEKMLTSAREDLQKEAGDKKMLEAAIKDEAAKEELSAQEGAETNELTVTSSKTYWVVVFLEEETKDEMEQKIGSTLEENFELVSGRLDEIEYKVLDKSKENGMTLSVSVIAYTTEKLELDQAKEDIPGKNENEVRGYFNEKESVLETEVKYWPFWVSKVPLNRSRIYININIQSANE